METGNNSIEPRPHAATSERVDQIAAGIGGAVLVLAVVALMVAGLGVAMAGSLESVVRMSAALLVVAYGVSLMRRVLRKNA